MEIVRPEIDSLEKSDAIEGQIIDAFREKYTSAIADPVKWLDEDIQRSVLLSSVDVAVAWARQRSIFPLMLGLACCAFEMIGMSASRFDSSRFGLDIFRWSPRQADLMIVAGTVTHKMAPAIRRLYDQMPEPKWVIAMGACAISGGTFRESYSVVPGLNHVVPVDVYVPGCPPRPEGLLYGIMQLHAKIIKGTVDNPNLSL